MKLNGYSSSNQKVPSSNPSWVLYFWFQLMKASEFSNARFHMYMYMCIYKRVRVVPDLLSKSVVLGDEFVGLEQQRRESVAYPQVTTCAKVLASHIQYLSGDTPHMDISTHTRLTKYC